MNLTYAGTHLTNGQPDNSTSCVTAFDQAGFMMGTSASLFNVSRLLVTIARLRDVVSVRSKSSTERTTYLSRLDPTGPVCYILYSGSCEM